jgi:hypothetical protein
MVAFSAFFVGFSGLARGPALIRSDPALRSHSKVFADTFFNFLPLVFGRLFQSFAAFLHIRHKDDGAKVIHDLLTVVHAAASLYGR